MNSEPVRYCVLLNDFVDLMEAATECAEDLEAEIVGRYGEGWQTQPVMVRKRERDMAIVNRLKEVLARIKAEPTCPSSHS